MMMVACHSSSDVSDAPGFDAEGVVAFRAPVATRSLLLAGPEALASLRALSSVVVVLAGLVLISLIIIGGRGLLSI